jgi:hypothetical protein
MSPFQKIPAYALIQIFRDNGGTIAKVRASVSGELPEIDAKDLTFTFGNGELIVSHDSDDENSRIFYADCYNGVDYVLVEN